MQFARAGRLHGRRKEHLSKPATRPQPRSTSPAQPQEEAAHQEYFGLSWRRREADVVTTVGLSKAYGSIHAVRDLTLNARRGEMFAVLGPPGAGKTTLIRLLLALQRPTGGRAAVLGRDAWRERGAIHRDTGYLPQELPAPPRLTGRQLVMWFARARHDVDQRVIAKLTELLNANLDRPLRQMSASERQKVGLVLAFMPRPELVMLDDPSAHLDPGTRRALEEVMRDTVNEGRTVLFATRDLDEAQRLASRVAVMKGGELVTTASVEGLRRAAPDHIEARIRKPVDGSVFASAGGARVTACSGTHIELEVTGRLAPVLRLLADLDPVDIVARHAELDDLFLSFQRRRETPSGAARNTIANGNGATSGSSHGRGTAKRAPR